MAAACVVGVLTGAAAIALAELIRGVQFLALGAPDLASYIVPWVPWWRVLLAGAIGGSLVALITRYFASEVRGHGVPDVMEAFALRGGRIRKRVALTRSIASALTIGTGGSVGREGPIVQVGAAVGSAVGQALRLPTDRLRMLTAAGAAGGIAAAFNAPIAGAFFALEVIARNFSASTFVPVVLCAVFSTEVARLYFGAAPAFAVPPLQVGHLWEISLAAVLGLACGLLSVFFIVVLHQLERLFVRLPIPVLLKPALGGLAVGALILGSPNLYGIGHETMDATLAGALPAGRLGLLLLLKPLATSLTLASGGSGGVFQPSLYIGGIAGALFSAALSTLLPAATTSSGAWALTGMAGVLAGASRAPVTAILLAFELTHDYDVTLPVMLASAVSTLVARALHRDSIYTAKLTERGIDLDRPEDLALRRVGVGEAMQPNPPAVRLDAPLDVVLGRFLDSDLGAVFVIDADGRLAGLVSIHDVKSSVADSTSLGGIAVAGDVSEGAASIRVDGNLADALDILTRESRDVLGVIDAEGRLVGALSLRTITDVIAREALRGEYVGVSGLAGGPRGHESLRLTGGVQVRALVVPPALVGATVRKLDVRSRWHVSVLALRSNGIDAEVDPDRPLAPGDTLVVMGGERDLDRFADSLRRGAVRAL
ncbi:MAG TPA: chloride channel protein [Myxococcota bacterium]|nr:chloride channel protein [Myxococcota bacterium]